MNISTSKNIQNGHDLEVSKPWPWLLDRGLKTITLHQELFLLGVAVQELLGVGDMQSGGDDPDKEKLRRDIGEIL